MSKITKSVALIIAAAIMAAVFACGYIMNMKANISDSLLRLHIKGASDSEYDQEMKLYVRDRIIADFSDEFQECSSAAAAAEMAERLKLQIEGAAMDELSVHGCEAEVTAGVERCRFPTRWYGGVALPGGEYTALNIKIGSAEGRNWWCVMYPPLCITDRSVVMSGQSRELLKNTLSEEEYELISGNERPDIKIKFRIAEILGKYFK